MKYFDLHADTVLGILQQGDEGSLYDSPKTQINIKSLQAGHALAQSFAIWLPDSNFEYLEIDPLLSPSNHEEDLAYIDLAVNRLHKEVENNSQYIAMAKNTAEILANEKAGKISAILTMEDSRAVDGSLENIKRFYDQGFRLFGIIWNHENCFGYPNSQDAELNAKGLKPFGIEAIQYMNELGVIADVSHLNDGGISDLLKYSKGPIIATHSNARAIADHSRNLSDKHIKGIANSGGVIGLCISPRFLRGYGENDSKIDDMVKHLDYIRNLGGDDVLAIGTDFDGTSGNLDIGSPADMPKLFDRLEKEGWPTDRIEKLAYKNALRLFKNF